MNVLSFSLWGNRAIYRVGMLANLKLAADFYPDWEVWVYHREIEKPFLTQLAKDGAKLKEFPCNNGMMARFLAIDEPDVERMLVKDADSRIGQREIGPVTEWVKSDLPFHTIRDHPHHIPPIIGGHFGCTKAGLKGTLMRQLAEGFSDRKGNRDEVYNSDQIFLAARVWPLARQRGCLAFDFCHPDLFPEARPFPAVLGDWRFVGERIDAEGKPEPGKWESRVNWMVPLP